MSEKVNCHCSESPAQSTQQYTASLIRSFGFDHVRSLIDTNMERLEREVPNLDPNKVISALHIMRSDDLTVSSTFGDERSVYVSLLGPIDGSFCGLNLKLNFEGPVVSARLRITDPIEEEMGWRFELQGVQYDPQQNI